MKTIAYTKRARRQWRKIPDWAQDQIDSALAHYAEIGEGDVVELVQREGCRSRSGDYRAIFVETEDEIEIRAVGHRKDVYD